MLLSVTKLIFNTLNNNVAYISVEDECGYKNLTYLAKVEGNRLKDSPFVNMPNKSLDELEWCVKQCDKTNGCRSIGFCPYSCYLYDKLIVEGEPRGEDKGCCTLYQSCSGNNFF